MAKENGFISGFKKFITRGNVLDMAVGVIIGASFNAIVNSLVNDIISPVIGLVTGGIDFNSLCITLVQATATSEAVTINIGTFINTIIQFLLIALILWGTHPNNAPKVNNFRETGEKTPAFLLFLRIMPEIH